MESAFHSTVMQRPQEQQEEEERLRRERMNGAGHHGARPYADGRSPKQGEIQAQHPHPPHPPHPPSNSHPHPHSQPHLHHPPPLAVTATAAAASAAAAAAASPPRYSPNGSLSRPGFGNTYHQGSVGPAPLSLASSTQVAAPSPSPSMRTPPSHQTTFKTTPRDKSMSNYYDPTSDSSERRPSESAWDNSSVQTPQARESYNYTSGTADSSARHYKGAYTSPINANFPRQSSPASHSHPAPRLSSVSHSPNARTMTSPLLRHNGVSQATVSPEVIDPETKPSRPSNPMSFSSILSSAEPAPPAAQPAPQHTPEPASILASAPTPVSAPARALTPAPAPATALVPAPATVQETIMPEAVAVDVPVKESAVVASDSNPTPAKQAPSTSEHKLASPAVSTPAGLKQQRKSSRASTAANYVTDEPPLRTSSRRSPSNITSASKATRVPSKRQANGQPKVGHQLAEKDLEIQSIMAQLDADASDIESAEFQSEKAAYQTRSLKRKLEIRDLELSKAKIRRKAFVKEMTASLGKHALAGELRYKDIHGDEAIAVVQKKEIEAEKERKKDMQRKRRREKTVATSLEQKDMLLNKAEATDDVNEKQKLLREAMRAEKKAHHTKIILARGDKGATDLRTVSPLEPNLHGGIMSTFAADSESGKTKGKGRGGARLRKSKEQKQAEKDSAEAAQAAIDAGEEPPQGAAPKKEKVIWLKVKKPVASNGTPDESAVKDKEAQDEPTVPAPAASAAEPYVSKGYNQIYDQIWRDLGRKDVTKVHKLAVESMNTKMSNLKKTAILASKEARRWQLRTNKSTKDLQARAKRTMREMMTFWKRNEREERDLRRAAEKQEIENARKAEADREANRQKRKLNFLISQTELYSHFIGKKMKTDEVERSTDHPDVATSTATVAPGGPDAHTVDLPDADAPAAKVTNFEDLDFDAEDDSTLKAAAMANAQNAIQEAQNKARSFNKANEGPEMDEEGEMNFQNPAGMGDVDIEQPKMLQAQLKEYQLKGLNWLVNLYEQGINGILADEMGLGKTVQSISVMAYLAEKHDIWGPFLVVAPASTLHNWQQEITKFVPTLKVLPYWGTASDRKVLRKFWDRKHITYTQDAPFHVLVTSYQLVVSDVAYFQKMRWQYMILDEAQAIKSSQSSRWKILLGFHCRNRLLLTGTPIQNNMQELWALLHFIMPSLFDSHDEFSEWFSKDIESHAQSNTKLNEDQLKRLHMILKPFMLRRVKKHVQKELGDKIEVDIFCDLTYRQRAYYGNLRNQISIMDLIERATIGDDDTGTLMNLVMQFRKVCNHPDLFERAETTSPFSFGYFAEAASFLREGQNVNVGYSTRNLIEYPLPRLVWREGGRLDLPSRENDKAGFRGKYLDQLMSIWKPQNSTSSTMADKAFSWLRFVDKSVGDIAKTLDKGIFARAVDLAQTPSKLGLLNVVYDEEEDSNFTPAQSMLKIVERGDRKPLAAVTNEGYLDKLFNVAEEVFKESGISRMEQCGRPSASAPPIQVHCSSRGAVIEKENVLFNVPVRRALYGPSTADERNLIEAKTSPSSYPQTKMLPEPTSERQRFTNIVVPSMRRFVTDSGKLAKLDELLFKLKEGGHRVLLYFQMTKMIDLMEEYLTYRNYKYLRLDGSTKLEDRRDTVHDFQTRPEIFIFLLSTRAGGLGINLTSADTVIFYDSDWNPTIDSQAMDRAHRLGQTRQVTVYRMITRGTIEERIRKRAMQKEEVQRVVISGGSAGGVDFNARSKENRTKDIAMWLADDDQAAEIERKEAEMAAIDAKNEALGIKKSKSRKRKAQDVNLDDMYHEGEGHFDDGSNKPSGTVTPVPAESGKGKGKAKKSGGGGGVGGGKKAKSAKQRLMMADGDIDMGGV